MVSLKDEAYKRGWSVVAHEHFEPVPDHYQINITRQLKRIRQTGTRIVILNCYKKYSRQVRTLLQRSEYFHENKYSIYSGRLFGWE